MSCTQTTPGTCDTCGRRVRWADLQSCRSSGPPGAAIVSPVAPAAPPARSCRDCAHRGEPVLAANGKQVGTEGCGCTSASAPSGVLWWICDLTDKPVRESRAASCDHYETKGT